MLSEIHMQAADRCGGLFMQANFTNRREINYLIMRERQIGRREKTDKFYNATNRSTIQLSLNVYNCINKHIIHKLYTYK